MEGQRVAPLARYQRCLICPSCNAGICRLLTSSTPGNPGRQFYKCPAFDHKFFKWADEVKAEEFINVPYCGGCSAGVCRVRREKSGPNAGRILFMCRVKEGEGSCGYRVWQDELEMSATGRADERVTSSQSATTNSDGTGPSYSSVVEEGQKHDVGADNESPVIDTSLDLQCKGKEPIESSKRPPKRPRYGDLKAPGSLISARSLTLHLAVNTVSIRHCWMAAAIRQNLSSELQGWWGRLAFHPMPCLMQHISKPFTCYSTFVVQDKVVLNSGDSTTLTQRLPGVEPFRVGVDEQSCSEPLREITTQNVMSKSISKAFAQAGKLLQNDLITLLETTNVKDHEIMSQAAEATFAALDRLLFDHQDFKERTKELVRCAISLEQTIPRNDSYQKLVDHCSRERVMLDEINRVHAEAVDAVAKNKKRLKGLQEEISSTMDWILELEAELSCCEVELRNMEQELDQISEKKKIFEGKYLIAQKFLEQKEMERNAAKAAFDRARALLRE